MRSVNRRVRTMKVMRATMLAIVLVMLAFPVQTKLISHTVYQIVVNGQVLGFAESEEAAKQAYLEARLQTNREREGLTLMDIQVSYEEAKTREDLLSNEELVASISSQLDQFISEEKTLAYTMQISDYTVTLGSRDEVVEVLEQAKSQYDEKNQFAVQLANLDVSEMGVISQESKSEEVAPSEEDGILSVDFKEEIQIQETYVSKEQISDVASALDDITKDKENNEIYEVQAGDCLSAIADSYDMTTKDLLAMNEGLEVDSNILIGDEIVVMVPKPELSVLVQEQKTYTETYEKEVEYVDNPDQYVGTVQVLQEPKEGTRTVTAIIHYENGTEYQRDIIKEDIIEEALPKIVERGTKALPTYIYPTSYGTLTSTFGPRWGTVHRGVDWAVPVGTACRASRAGRVVTAGWCGGYGYSVLLDHGDGVQTRYGHLSSVLVSPGQYVEQGDKIALTGNTGDSTGPHIHFEIIVNGTKVNPFDYF